MLVPFSILGTAVFHQHWMELRGKQRHFPEDSWKVEHILRDMRSRKFSWHYVWTWLSGCDIVEFWQKTREVFNQFSLLEIPYVAHTVRSFRNSNSLSPSPSFLAKGPDLPILLVWKIYQSICTEKFLKYSDKKYLKTLRNTKLTSNPKKNLLNLQTMAMLPDWRKLLIALDCSFPRLLVWI